MMKYSHIAVAIPLMAESENLPNLVSCLEAQTFRNFEVFFCVNQPESFRHNPEKEFICHDNQESLEYLQKLDHARYSVIDRSSSGKGWDEKHQGVGHARKVLFDTILKEHSDDTVIVSLDGDTSFNGNYFQSIVEQFNRKPTLSAVSVPYFHPLPQNGNEQRTLLRYEIYMRHYMLNMLLIRNPYAFTALGSAMAFPIWAYRKSGGITPLQGGEDFYLMQKLRKTGKISVYNEECVYPQGRTSFRVPFGTGPAVQKDIAEQDSSYPFYSGESFDKVGATFDLFPQLFESDKETPMSEFLRSQLKTDELWNPIRRNFKTVELFVKSCTERVDGLRILQFLKSEHVPGSSENNFMDFCKNHDINLPVDFSFEKTDIRDLERLRNILFEKEMKMRKSFGE